MKKHNIFWILYSVNLILCIVCLIFNYLGYTSEKFVNSFIYSCFEVILIIIFIVFCIILFIYLIINDIKRKKFSIVKYGMVLFEIFILVIIHWGYDYYIDLSKTNLVNKMQEEYNVLVDKINKISEDNNKYIYLYDDLAELDSNFSYSENSYIVSYDNIQIAFFSDGKNSSEDRNINNNDLKLTYLKDSNPESYISELGDRILKNYYSNKINITGCNIKYINDSTTSSIGTVSTPSKKRFNVTLYDFNYRTIEFIACIEIIDNKLVITDDL